MKNIALIIAGGVGARMGQDIPKQFINVYDKPVLVYTMEAFQKHPDIDGIEVVCLEGWHEILKAYARQFGIAKLEGVVNGGKNGQDSIRNGLLDIQSRHPEDDTIVLVHDAIRPMLSQEIISENIRVCREKGNAITVVPCTAAMLKTYDSECSEEQVPRDNLKITQTPQTFFLNEIVETHKEALEKAYQYLNDDKAVCVFPEGTYHKEKGQLLPFKMGAVKMARKTNSMLIPFAIVGKYKRGKMKIIYGKGYYVESDDLEKENEKLKQKVLDLIKSYEV